MDDNTLETLYNLMKNEKYIVNSKVKVRKILFDDSEEVYCFVYPRKSMGEYYYMENYSKQSFFVYKLCEEGYSIEKIVDNMMNMKNSPSILIVFKYVLHTIREFQKRGIIYEKNI